MDIRFMTIYRFRLQKHLDGMNMEKNQIEQSAMSIDFTEINFDQPWFNEESSFDSS